MEWAYRSKEQEVEADVTARLIDKENARLLWLKEQQVKERREVFEEHLPSGSDDQLKEIITKMSEEDEKELEEFRREQEADKIQKMKELEQ